MSERSQTTRAVWVACLGIGLLFMARGAFVPYFFPIFENLTDLSYGQISLLLNLYVFSQSVCAPLAGLYTDRTSVRTAVVTAIVLGSLGFLLVLHASAFALLAVAMAAIGSGFVLGKIAFNALLVDSCSHEELRRGIAGRAMVLNLGSFFGNALALQVIEGLGHKPLVLLLFAANFTLVVAFLAPRPPAHSGHPAMSFRDLAGVVRNKAFMLDTLRLFSIYVPYGCWGTIIPKYVIDVYGSEEPVRYIGFVSLCTYLGGSYFIGSWLAPKFYRWGFQWRWWTVVCGLCYCGGLLLLCFAANAVVLAAAIAVFICGEILMTQCFAETAKRHAQAGKSGTYQGVLHVFEGGGRVVGSMTALAAYGWMQGSVLADYYWLIMAPSFFLFSATLHGWAYRKARRLGEPETAQPAVAASVCIDTDEFEP
jgi:predicted MFS family arabinose efflux permease